MKKYYLFFLSIICIGLTIEPTFATSGATTADDYRKFFSFFSYDTILTGIVRGLINGLTPYNLTGYSGLLGFVGSLTNVFTYLAAGTYVLKNFIKMWNSVEEDGSRFSKEEYIKIIKLLLLLVLLVTPTVGYLLTGLVAFIKTL